MGIHADLTLGQGYHLGQRLTEPQLAWLRERITDHYLDRLRAVDPSLADEAARLGIENYHRLQHGLDHGKFWPKTARVLPAKFAADMRTMDFYKAIEREYGPVVLRKDELNWRLVRPHAANDVGSIHADHWFYGDNDQPAGWDRFKVWIPIYTEPGLNGLCVKPYSQLKNDWKYHIEMRNGQPKPVFDEDVEALNMQLLPLAAGEMVMFHDAMLHGGVVNRGIYSRVSLELTIWFPSDFETLHLGRTG